MTDRKKPGVAFWVTVGAGLLAIDLSDKHRAGLLDHESNFDTRGMDFDRLFPRSFGSVKIALTSSLIHSAGIRSSAHRGNGAGRLTILAIIHCSARSRANSLLRRHLDIPSRSKCSTAKLTTDFTDSTKMKDRRSRTPWTSYSSLCPLCLCGSNPFRLEIYGHLTRRKL